MFALLAGVGFLPLFGGPGYEQSLASGLVLPSAAAIAVALELSAGPGLAPLACVVRGMGHGLVLVGVAFVTALLHALRVGACDFWGGTTFFVLTAGVGAPLGGVWGALVAEAARARRRRRLWCVLLALAAPLAGVAVSVARFYASPMIFAFDPFFGYFSGSLYDTIVDVRAELWTYRAGTLATLAGAGLAASSLARTGAGVLTLRPLRGDRGAAARLAAGLVALLVSLAGCFEGPSLGHWQSAASIGSALGGHASGPRCDVLHTDSLLAGQVALLVRDCEQQLAAVERRLGARLDGRLTVYAFRDANQKRELMGAAETSIAKPWRREVYVQVAGFPHPVLGHEIAHVVAGTFARGPLRVGGGWWPNPGLIEGTAVAASPDDDELTDAQWARAMLDLGLLPPMRDLFSLRFLGQSAEKSYTAAGAFVTWVLDRWGPGVVHAWYGGDPLDALVGLRWDALDAEFRSSLLSLTMPAESSTYASAKFRRPGVWARTCPHVVDALDRAADRCRDEHRFARAADLYERALASDPQDWHARLDRARVELRYRDEAAGREQLAAVVADEGAPRTWRDRAQEALADDDLLHGRDARAVEAYRVVAARTLDEDAARTLEVKALGPGDPRARRAIVDLLIGEPGRPVDSWIGALSTGVWAGETRDPLAAYLAGKNLVSHEDWANAASWLDAALAAGVPTARIGRELLRERAVCACALADAAALARMRDEVEAAGSPFAAGAGGRREWVLRLVARCK